MRAKAVAMDLARVVTLQCEYILKISSVLILPLVALLHRSLPAPIAQLVECPLRGTGGHGFDPGPRYTKVVENGTTCSSIGTQIYGVELGLVDLVSG